MAPELGDAKFLSCWGLEGPETKNDYWAVFTSPGY